MQALRILFLFLSLSFCASAQNTAIELRNDVFETGVGHIFNFQFSYKKQQQSGIAVIKRISADERRVVVTSLFGGTLLDMTLYSKSYQVNYVLKELDKRFLLNLFFQDFDLITKNSFMISSYEGSTYFADYDQGKLTLVQDVIGLNSLKYQVKKKKVLTIEYLSKNDKLDAIELKHFDKPIKMTFKKQENGNVD